MIDWAKIILEIKRSGMNSTAIAVWCQLRGVEDCTISCIRRLTYENAQRMKEPRYALGDALLELHRKVQDVRGAA